MVTRNKELESIILSKYTDMKAINEFTGLRCVYQDIDKKRGEDMNLAAKYDEAVKAVDKFVRGILQIELSLSESNSASATIFLPNKCMEIALGYDVDAVSDMVKKEDATTRIHTQYGEFSEFAYKLVQEIPFSDNPIKAFYSHIDKSLDVLEDMLAKRGKDNTDSSRSVLGAGINDILCIHKFPIVRGVRASFPDYRVTDAADDDDFYFL